MIKDKKKKGYWDRFKSYVIKDTRLGERILQRTDWANEGVRDEVYDKLDELPEMLDRKMMEMVTPGNELAVRREFEERGKKFDMQKYLENKRKFDRFMEKHRDESDDDDSDSDYSDDD